MPAEEVSLPLPDGAGQLVGTLLQVPDADTLVVLVSGSGPTDRDGNQPQLQNNSMKLVADGLATLGVSTLRFDKRGSGHSTLHGFREEDVRLQTYVGDVVLWVKRMRQQGRYKKIGLLGHSEGGLVASMAAAKLLPDFVILLETPGRPLDEVLKEQLASKLPEPLMQTAISIMDALKSGKLVSDVPDVLQSIFRPSVQPYWVSMFANKPADLVKPLNMPLLILQGTQDLQVGTADAAQLGLAKPAARVCLIQGMNHVLKHVDTPVDQAPAYTDPTLPLSSALIPDIAAFLKTLGIIKVKTGAGTVASASTAQGAGSAATEACPGSLGK